jgi:hypothetical protein
VPDLPPDFQPTATRGEGASDAAQRRHAREVDRATEGFPRAERAHHRLLPGPESVYFFLIPFLFFEALFSLLLLLFFFLVVVVVVVVVVVFFVVVVVVVVAVVVAALF